MRRVVAPLKLAGVRGQRLARPLRREVRPIRRARVADEPLPGDGLGRIRPPLEIGADDAVVRRRRRGLRDRSRAR